MKAKNEEIFTYMRVLKSTVYKIREINAKEKQRENRGVKMYETVASMTDKEINK